MLKRHLLVYYAIITYIIGFVAVILLSLIAAPQVYNFVFGEQNSLEFTLTPGRYNGTISYSEDGIELGYVPEIRTNYFNINVPFNEATKLKAPKKAKVELKLQVPSSLDRLVVVSDEASSSQNIFFRNLEGLGDPDYVTTDARVWVGEQGDLDEAINIVNTRTVPSGEDDHVFTFDYPLTSELPNLPGQFDRNYRYDLFARGSHSGYFYVSSDRLQMVVEKYDLNWYTGEDILEFNVFDLTGDLIFSKILNDDGIDSASRGFTPQIQSLYIDEQIQPGAYLFQIVSGDSIVPSITGNIPYLVLKDQYYIAAADLYTDKLPEEYKARTANVGNMYGKLNVLAALTTHVEAFSTIKFGNSQVTLRETGQAYDFNLPTGVTTGNLTVPFSDVILSFDGFLAVKSDNYFTPIPVNLSNVTSYSNFGRNYIVIANYSDTDFFADLLTTRFEVEIPAGSDSLNLDFQAIHDLAVGGVIEIDSVKVTFE